MKPRKTTFLLHRWVGLVISLQLLAWSVGGFTFSILDLDNVHGDTDSQMIEFTPLSAQAMGQLPEPVQSRLATLETDSLAQVALVDRGLGAHWEVRGSDSRLLARLNLDGERAGLVTPEQAERIALRDFVPEDGSGEASVKSTTLIEAEAPSEYREKPLPAYRVELEHVKQPHIYINAQTGQITARRNRSWRAFDFFWMLHTMDYKGRDNFNHWLLTGASLLAIFTALSGIALWGWRVKGRLGRWRRNNRLSARV